MPGNSWRIGCGKKLGCINAVAPILDELKANRFYFSETVRSHVLNLVDEIESSE